MDFLVREKGAYAEFFISTPVLGKGVRRKVEEEDRMIDYDWSN
ncbi:MAG: hypothetical protein ABSB32_10035 [Thermodesulfobacteriota bacterium]